MTSRLARTLLCTAAAAFCLPATNAFAADGALDTNFSGDGKLPIESGGGATVFDIAAFDDGRIVAVGEFTGGAEVAVYKKDGTLDSTFSDDGLATIPSFNPTQVAVDDDGRVALAQAKQQGVNASDVVLAVGRLDATGHLDAAFGGGDGLADELMTRDMDDIAVDSSDRIVAVGSFKSNADFEVTRWNAAGALDGTFSGDGQVDINASPIANEATQFESAEAVAIQPDGKIVVAGGVDVSSFFVNRFGDMGHAMEASFVVIRVTTAGALDTTFASGTGRSYPNIVTGTSDCDRVGTSFNCSNELESAMAVTVESDGQIAASGFTDSDADADIDGDTDVEQRETDFAVAHLNANGSTDTGFSGDGRVSTAIAPNASDYFFDDDTAIGVSEGPGGSVVASGTTTKEASGSPGNFDGDFAFVRYLANGSLDPAFDGASSGNGKVTVVVKDPANENEVADSAALLPNGNVALGGHNNNPEYGAIAVIRNDGTAPDTQITSGPSEGSTITVNGATFSFSAVGEPAVNQFECSYGGPFVSCASPYSKKLPDGAQTFTVRARDAAGNVDASPAVRHFTVDATPPDTNLTGNPGTLTADTTPTFTFTSTPGGGTFKCAVVDGHGLPDIDDSEFASCASGFSPPLTDGEYTFAVRASDAGGEDPTPATFEFEVDTDPPDGVIVSGPGPFINIVHPQFEVSTDEPLDIPEGEFTMTCALTGPVSPSVPCTDEPFEFAPALPEGVYTFTLTVQDSLARTDATPATLQFEVDTTPPDTSFTKKPRKKSTKRRPKVNAASTEPAAPVRFLCSLDGADFSECDLPMKLPKLSFGKHTFAVAAVDRAGNQDPDPAVARFKVVRKL